MVSSSLTPPKPYPSPQLPNSMPFLIFSLFMQTNRQITTKIAQTNQNFKKAKKKSIRHTYTHTINFTYSFFSSRIFLLLSYIDCVS